MRNKINFISGETYSLAEVFSGERRIIIPDLQRDYCWGNAEHTEERKELVSGFVGVMIDEFNDYQKNKGLEPVSRGLVYGFEVPENHIQLCDGQQRITTLYLLIGMLNRKIGDNSLRHYLITVQDEEPYLQYAIRESSLYFLSDLVHHFFIKAPGDEDYVMETARIRDSAWFFNEYGEDPSILSMLNALKIIDDLLKDYEKPWVRTFSDFLMNKVSFMYYDLDNRKNGEETFVVINTTGEPLSSVQNLKPMVMDATINSTYVNLSGEWEEIETWFWKRRIESNGNDTADAGFTEFLRWVTMLKSSDDSLKTILQKGKYAFPQEIIRFEEIKEYWCIVKFLFEDWALHDKLDRGFLSPAINKESGCRVIGQIDCFVLLPLMAYCKRWEIKDSNDRGLLRLFKFLENLTRKENIRKDVNTIVGDAILLAEYQDVMEASGISKSILSDEEVLKLGILKSCADEETRRKTEEAIWKAQDTDTVQSHNIWSGEIMPLINWSMTSGVFRLDVFEKYLQRFDAVFSGDFDNSSIDDVRRSLLAIRFPEYPRIFHGNTNYSFGWKWSDWKMLIFKYGQEFKDFLDRLNNGETYSSIIGNCPADILYYDFVSRKYLLEYCEQKNIQLSARGVLLVRKIYATESNYISVLNMHLYKYLEKEALGLGWSISNNGNSVFAQKGKMRLRIENKSLSEWDVRVFENDVEKDKKSISISTTQPYEYPEVLDLLKLLN